MVGSPRISVAMCTFQGERYLEEQLESIAQQTRPPDELLVCDDGSADGTLAILDRFQTRVPFPVRLQVNEERLGPTKNFEQAISSCEGDLIFLSDQDDVWHRKKLQVLTAVLSSAPNSGAVFSNAEVVDERSAPRGYSVWEAVGYTPRLQRRLVREGALGVLLKRNVVGGMTLGFRSRFRQLILPMPGDWFHDCWIPLLIAAVADVVMVPDRLVRYRQHHQQRIGLSEKGFREKLAEKQNEGRSTLLRLAEYYAAAHERLAAQGMTYPCSPEALRGLEDKIRHIRARAEIKSGNHRFKLVMREVLARNYQRFSSGWKSVAVDAFLS